MLLHEGATILSDTANKTETITIRLTQKQKELIFELAEGHNLDVSKLIMILIKQEWEKQRSYYVENFFGDIEPIR